MRACEYSLYTDDLWAVDKDPFKIPIMDKRVTGYW